MKNDKESKFNRYQKAAQLASDDLADIMALAESKYRCKAYMLGCYGTRGEATRYEKAKERAARTQDRLLNYIREISPHCWEVGYPVAWLVHTATFQDITAGEQIPRFFFRHNVKHLKSKRP